MITGLSVRGVGVWVGVCVGVSTVAGATGVELLVCVEVVGLDELSGLGGFGALFPNAAKAAKPDVAPSDLGAFLGFDWSVVIWPLAVGGD